MRLATAPIWAASLLVAAAMASVPAHALSIADPAGDFLPSFTGARGGDLDVLATSGTLLGSQFAFTARLNGTVGTTPGSFYVFGVNRGQGTARFGALAPGVLFDSVVIVTPGSASVVRDLVANTAVTLAAASTTIAGSGLEVDLPAALLPTEGLAPDAYTFNLWPRTSAPASGTTPVAGNAQISDFAPDNGNLAVTVPEPASLALAGLALLGLAGARRRGHAAVSGGR